MTVENNTTDAAKSATATEGNEQNTTTQEENLLGDDQQQDGGDAAAADKNDANAEGGEGEGNDEEDLLDGKVNDDSPVSDIEDGHEFTIPEGMQADAELAATFTPIAKEMGWTKEQAQKFVDQSPKLLAAVAKSQAQQWAAVKSAWAQEAKKDPDIYDAAAKAVRPEIAKAREYFGPEFAAALKLGGLNNHPAVLKQLAKVGQALGEDTPGFGTKVTKRDPLRQMYPNDVPETKE